MKLAALYTVFNGLELLDKSILNILLNVDKIVLCVNTHSHFGVQDDRPMKEVEKYRNQPGFHIISYTPDLKLSSKENERIRLQFKIDKARELGCTHFIAMAEDHFYVPKEFKKAKKMVEFLSLDTSFTRMFTYYKYPTWRLTPIEDYSCPFITRLDSNRRIAKNPQYPVKVDPSVQIDKVGNWHEFDSKTIMLHHFSMVRDDIRYKFENAAASIRWGSDRIEVFMKEYESYDLNLNPGISYFKGRKIEVVEDLFNIR